MRFDQGLHNTLSWWRGEGGRGCLKASGGGYLFCIDDTQLQMFRTCFVCRHPTERLEWEVIWWWVRLATAGFFTLQFLYLNFPSKWESGEGKVRSSKLDVPRGGEEGEEQGRKWSAAFLHPHSRWFRSSIDGSFGENERKQICQKGKNMFFFAGVSWSFLSFAACNLSQV